MCLVGCLFYSFVDSGISVKALIDEIKKRMRKNCPEQIKVATVYYKSKRNKVSIKPDFFIHDTDEWVVFPHELEGLTDDEIKEKDPQTFKLVQEILKE